MPFSGNGTACVWGPESCGIAAEQERLEQSQGLVVMGWHSSTEPLSLEQCSEELESWLWPTGETSDGQGSISVL